MHVRHACHQPSTTASTTTSHMHAAVLPPVPSTGLLCLSKHKTTADTVRLHSRCVRGRASCALVSAGAMLFMPLNLRCVGEGGEQQVAGRDRGEFNCKRHGVACVIAPQR